MILVYEQLADTSRRRLLAELRTGPKTVSDLVDATLMKQPNVSSHLARMRAKEVVRAEKIGRQVFYSFASTEIEEVVKRVLTEREVCLGDLNPEEASRSYATAAVAGDEGKCCEVVDHVLRLQICLLEIYQDVLGPAMVLIGQWYRAGEIDTAQEHMASAITERMMARIMQKFAPTCRQDRTAVLGCGPNSWHVIGLRMVADYLNYCGWRTMFLGANVPNRCFLNMVQQNDPNLVLVSCVAADGLDCGLSLVRELKELKSKGSKFVVGAGGPIVCQNSQLFRDAGADFTCSNLRTFAKEYLPCIEKKGFNKPSD